MARKSINEYLRKIALAVNPGAVADKRRQSDNEYVRRIAEGVEAHADEIVGAGARVSSLDETVLATGTVVDVTGIPTYVADVADYDEWGIEETGWYVFARVLPRGTTVSQAVTVDGVAGYVVGAEHIDLAVRFEVAAQSCPVTIHWGDFDETIVFRATDLAVRNLDYRVTFYVYDLDEFATWEYKAVETATLAGTEYWEEDGEGGYQRAAVIAYDSVPADTYYEHAYALTTDETFVEGKTYYTKSDSTYSAAEVVAGSAVAANTYYEDVWTLTTHTSFKGTAYYVAGGDGYERAAVVAGQPSPVYYVDCYTLTEDGTFVEGKTYYTESGGTYSAAEVTAGDEVTPGTYYEHSYVVVDGGTFTEGTTYYNKSGATYSATEVTPGADVPTVYYVHSKVTFEGMVRNVTYRCNTPIDCPATVVLPVIPDDGHGAWFDFQFYVPAAQSLSLQKLDPDAKVAANGFGSFGGNNVNNTTLHYANTAGVKIWRATNIAANLPAQ